MDHTIRYLTQVVFDTPFDFFQAFGDYWDEQGWSKIGHQLEYLFQRLYQFLKHHNIPHMHMSVIEGLMKYHFLLHHKHKPRKTWWQTSLSKSERREIIEQIIQNPQTVGEEFSLLNLTEQDLHKHTVIETFDFHIEHFVSKGSYNPLSVYLMMYYDNKKQTKQSFTLPKDSIQSQIV